MINIILFSQNVRLDSMCQLVNRVELTDTTVFLTPHMLYVNECEYLQKTFPNCKFHRFSEFLSDTENALCDNNAFSEKQKDIVDYFTKIKALKNKIIVQKINELYPVHNGFLCSDDLGIDVKIWKREKFKKVECDYFYIKPHQSRIVKTYQSLHRKAYNIINRLFKGSKNIRVTKDIYVAFQNEMKYVFLGKLDRIAYRTDLEWIKSEEEREKIAKGCFETRDKCQYLSTLHEAFNNIIPDKIQYDVRYIQDGYLPPNYTSAYLKFKPKNVSYYTWDVMGEINFKLYDLPVMIMPFRKKLYLPKPRFSDRVRKVLVATSGPGDWTAQKNRSDEDLMLEAFIQVAKLFTNIEFVYRCHPTWIHPEHNGVNSINRVMEYINYSGCKNLRLSTNIPVTKVGSFSLSFPRISLEEDLKNVDLVFGEHSVSMIDAGFKRIPFASVNLTDRRNLFSSMTDMGFPHCKSVQDIFELISSYNGLEFQHAFDVAVERYNKMTDYVD